MTTPQPKVETKGARADADDTRVAQYLAGHPEFFEKHASLLAHLKLPHHRGDGSTVSLVERQVDVLREKNRELELRLRTLVENARANEVLADKIHRLATRLIHARTPEARLAAVEAALREDFDAREFVVVLANAASPLAKVDARYVRVAAPDDPGLRSFDSLFAAGKPRCGRVRDSQREWLFPASDAAVGSVALVPLGPGGAVGLLAIASPDADHFNPTMSTDFLARIGELVGTALE
jgi:uncharacterized protein YigA (DUF484 family)